jgi:hypothetical protein
MDIVIVDLIGTNVVQWASMMIGHAMMMDAQKKTRSYKLNEHKTMISFPLLLKHMSVFIFILIHFYHLCIDHYRMLSWFFLMLVYY